MDDTLNAGAPEESLIGELLGDTYRIERLLGRGGMGAVWVATNVRLGKPLAVKMLTSLGDDAGATLRRFRREAEVTTAIGHPHIVQVVDFNATPDGRPYMVMELLEGWDLADRLEQPSTLSAEQAVRVMRQVCWALEAAHQRGVIHRDLKPSNIFLCTNQAYPDFVKVVDFGISKLLGSATLTTEDAILGTPHYMAPEQAEGLADEIGPATDVFAAGAILYRMLSGRVPFDSDSIPTLLYRIVYADPEPLDTLCPQLDRRVVDVVMGALQKDPRERYPSARALSAELLAICPQTAIGPPWESRGEAAEGPPVAGRSPGEIDGFGATERSTERGAGRGAARPQSTFSTAAAELRHRSRRHVVRHPATWITAVVALAAASAIVVLGGRGDGPSGDGSSPRATAPAAAVAPSVMRTPAATRAVEEPVATAPPSPAAPERRPAAASSPPASKSASRGAAADRHAAGPVRVTIELRGRPRGARVVVQPSGRLLGHLPLSRKVERSSSALRLRIEKRGFHPKNVAIVPDRSRARTIRLRREAPTEDMPINPFHR